MKLNETLKISEIFFSLQGEGPLIGYPTLFIRLFGCNLNCKWCDTLYAKKGNSYKIVEISEIINFWKSNYPDIPYITITGGEPLLQRSVYILMEQLIKRKAIIVLETNGTLSLNKVNKDVIKVMDIKTPSSGMDKYNLYENLKYLDRKDAVKFVIKDKEDFNFSINIVEKFHILYYTQVFFSPATPFLDPKNLAQWILENKIPIRFQIQLHKFLDLK